MVIGVGFSYKMDVMMTKKWRADQLMVQQKLADNRTQAAAFIMAGVVRNKGRLVEKPGQQFSEENILEVERKPYPWVSRAGVKLAHALDYFQLSAQTKICLDIGASTGGFCDVLLQQGAAKIYAVDVGRGQLAWKIAQDSRVKILDQTNARYLTDQQISEPLQAITCDASFISLKLILPAALQLAAEDSWLIALIKPQFEVGRQQVGKGGIVRDPQLHQAVCQDIAGWVQQQAGWQVMGITDSPITGTDGNREFLIAAIRHPGIKNEQLMTQEISLEK